MPTLVLLSPREGIERKSGERQKPLVVEYRRGISLADQLVVVVKLL